MLERYGHGGDLRTAEEVFGMPAESFVDFSSNMNPLGPPKSVRDVMARYWEHIQAYPDPASRALKAKLAERHRIPESSILVGNGAAELIDLAVRAIRPQVTALAMPCFDEYGDAVRKCGGEIYAMPLDRTANFELSEDAVREAIDQSGAALYVLGSPNNPTGRLLDAGLVRLLLDSGAHVVIDEAFLDFVPEEEELTLLREAASHERLIVLRSMTKFYAVPGIRLGYAVGKSSTISRLRRLQVPWSVNSLAQQIGETVLMDVEFEAETKSWLLSEREWLTDGLRRLGCCVTQSVTNYLLVRLPEGTGLSASQLQLEMGRRGVLVRDASRFQGLDHTYIRVAVKLREHNLKLLAALADCFGEQFDGHGGSL
ncbi:threonine-phosphate decarboxylase CobD [Paenibacillus sp. LHD-117]|uniref:threonine-phosphate decarboxylase CobD n=1 Tax=Paenibacillus sp. LHD-117 TaxID=3071412 RepID=UPI0027E0DAFD|nr:threonine-phosphate decarboxylase CobD [Paenibacillus sp. LHD-117]MDQ6421603.1 threonine-phosphate decarboxylase CobD [Paenibacillus sp. LHD-117]